VSHDPHGTEPPPVPERPTLRQYQVEGRDFLAQRARALLYDDPGCGKTPQAVTALTKLDGPVTVVCPAVALGVWRRQFATWAPDYEVRVHVDTKATDAPTGRQALLTTYDRARVTGHGRFGVICDEAHLVKNPVTKRSKRVKALTEAGRSYVWQLTGTPILSWPSDLWGQISLLGIAEQCYRTKTAFCKLFGGEYGVGGMAWNPKKIHPDAYAPLKNYMIRRLRSEVLELPPRTSEEWWVELPKRLASRFADICARIPPESPTWEASAAGGELASALADLSAIKAEASLQSIKELEPTPDNPVVVFTAHKDAARIVAHAMDWPCIDGDTPAAQRSAYEHAFQNGNYSGLVLTIQAGGTAITLTRARTVVFAGETYVPALNEQAADRIYRYGQTRDVRAIYVRAESPLEAGLQAVLARKRPFGKIG
jgi:superfamily II DNA or RNA helicase